MRCVKSDTVNNPLNRQVDLSTCQPKFHKCCRNTDIPVKWTRLMGLAYNLDRINVAHVRVNISLQESQKHQLCD